MRLNRYLAGCGYGSRRACEELISSGEVTVNGAVCTNLATTIGEGDEVYVGKKPARLPDLVYYAMHKPKGYITTAADTHSRRTIFDLLPPELGHLHYVGRLDQDSEGLLLLTNDGELSHRLAHPSRGVEKEYEVTLEQPWDPKSAKRLLGGMLIEDKSAKFERIQQIGPNTLRIVLHQGLKRQIRVMLLYVGYKVKTLVRIRIGELTLERLPRGSHRKLRPHEVKALKIQAGMIKGAPVKANAAAPKPRPLPPSAEKRVTVKYVDENRPRASRRPSTKPRIDHSERPASLDRPKGPGRQAPLSKVGNRAAAKASPRPQGGGRRGARVAKSEGQRGDGARRGRK